MNTSLKKLCIFSVAAGVAQEIYRQSGDEDLSEIDLKLSRDNAIELHRTSIKAIDNCHAKVDKCKFRQAKKRVDMLKKDGEIFDVTTMLSMLFLGLADLSAKCNDTSYIDSVKDSALNFITLYDPNLSDEETHSRALQDYESWLK